MTLGQLIRNYRKKQHISLRTFATRCSLSPAYISILERNTNCSTNKEPTPSLDSIVAIANAMESDSITVMKAIGIDINEKAAQATGALPPPSVSGAHLIPFEHIPVTTDTLMAAVKEHRILILPFRALRKGDSVWIPMKLYGMAVMHLISEVNGGIYTATAEAVGDVTFSIFDIGHTVFTSYAEANKTRAAWEHDIVN